MANWISQQLGKINKEILDLTSDPKEIMTSPVNKLWRAAILAHRSTHSPHQAISTKDPGEGLSLEVKQEYREKAGRLSYPFQIDLNPHIDLLNLKSQTGTKNDIILYNLSSTPYRYIVLQNRPNSLEHKGETTWATIKSMGRNTPMYHYTGAEDTIQFQVSWYCNDPDHPDEVVNKCRLLEAWSKSNGYQAAPPIIAIEWGGSKIYEGQKFILISATYTLSNFNDKIRSDNRQVKDGRLLPSTATQELIFKRVSSTNLTYPDILPIDKMNYTRGINRK